MSRRWRWALMSVLLATSAWLALFGDKTPPGAATSPATTAQAPKPAPGPTRVAQAGQGSRDAASPEVIETLQPRTVQPGESDAPVADLFRNAAWRAPPAPEPAPAAVVIAATPQPAPVPPHPYRLIGKKLDAEVWEVFLGRGDTSFIVRAGDTVEGAWSVERIEPPTLTLTHLTSGQKQTLDIGVRP